MPTSGRTRNSGTASKPKSSRKRKKDSVNLYPESRKKRAVASSKNYDDDLDDEVDNKRTRHRENKKSSELSSDEDEENCEAGQLASGGETNQTTSTVSITRSSTSELTVVTPEVSDREGHSMQNDDGFQIQTDKSFIQQQVQLLETPFTLKDCRGLTSRPARRNNSIPHDVINEALRKLQHKTDDEIRRHLNRQCQRKVLSELLEIEGDATTVYENRTDQKGNLADTMSVSEILEKCSENLGNNGDINDNLLRRYSHSLVELRTLNEEMKKMKQRVASYESNNLMILEVESLARETTRRSLQKEVAKTSKLANQVTGILRRRANLD